MFAWLISGSLLLVGASPWLVQSMHWRDQWVLSLMLNQASYQSWEAEVLIRSCSGRWPTRRLCMTVGDDEFHFMLWRAVHWRSALNKDVLRVRNGLWSFNGSLVTEVGNMRVAMIHNGWFVFK